MSMGTTMEQFWENEVELMRELRKDSPDKLEQYVHATRTHRKVDFFGVLVDEVFWARFGRAEEIALGLWPAGAQPWDMGLLPRKPR